MASPEYPLKQIVEVKKKRIEAAEKVVQEKLAQLQKEQKKLQEREEERNKVKTHKVDKLQQLRATIDAGTTSPKIQQMKGYLKIVDEKLKIEEKKVQDQQNVVKGAEKELETAKSELHQRRQDADKIEMHKQDWTKEKKKEMEVAEGREQDELGSIIFTTKHRKK